jgi:general secretion pathway protein B
MSYILDALRRADAERLQGQVPGLHAQAEPLGGPARLRGLSARHGAWLLAGLAGLAVLVLLAAWLLRPTAATTALVTAPGPVPAPNPAGRVEPRPSALPIVVSSAPALPALVASAQRGQAQPAVTPAVAAPAMPASMPLPALSLQQLGADQRRELPALVVGGSVWSDSAAARFVIIDGQVIREGEALAPGLVLERVLPRSALLRWRGTLLEIKF